MASHAGKMWLWQAKIGCKYLTASGFFFLQQKKWGTPWKSPGSMQHPGKHTGLHEAIQGVWKGWLETSSWMSLHCNLQAGGDLLPLPQSISTAACRAAGTRCWGRVFARLRLCVPHTDLGAGLLCRNSCPSHEGCQSSGTCQMQIHIYLLFELICRRSVTGPELWPGSSHGREPGAAHAKTTAAGIRQCVGENQCQLRES